VRDGKPFAKTTLARFLGNPIFTGNVIHQGHVYPGEHKGIIRKATFERVQTILAKNHVGIRSRTKNKYGFLLKGLFRCGACDAPYIPSTTRKGSKVYRFYVCSSAQKKGATTCPKASFSAHRVEAWIVDQIRVIGKDPMLQAEVLKQASHQIREQRATLDAEAKRLKSNREKVQRETTGLLKALACGTANGPAISGRLGELEDQAARLATRAAEVDQEQQAADQATLDPDDLHTALGLFDPIWDVLFPAEQARIIELLVKRVEYDDEAGNLAITFHPTGIRELVDEAATEATT